MDFSFLFNGSTITFIIAFFVFFGWQAAKLATPKWFYPIEEDKKKRVAEIITLVNVGIGVVAAIILTAFGFFTNFWDSVTSFMAIMGSGSVFDVLKAYNVVK
jgi:fatty acid desaturase